uniref:tRNA-dihydrouridine(20) synthase (NAD(P)+)-like n=1 Tax=Hirondellea gigas TaxID=1518452 RepID=A0A2P2I822_9CRUS
MEDVYSDLLKIPVPKVQMQKIFADRYRNKVIVAPMVRICTLPFRLLALDYGADLVYSEETIDWKIMRAEERHNDALGTIDFVDMTEGTVFLRTCKRERGRLIVQIGTSDAARALQVAKRLEPYVAGIDVNMGCPKEFSIKGGMGAALLTQPRKIHEILSTLVNGLQVPVTCKIRILPDLADTLTLCRIIERSGVAAIAVHGRKKDERPQHPNNESVIAEIARVINIPVIANGGSKDIIDHKDIKLFGEKSQTCSVMIARAAMWNCSILRREGKLPIDDVIRAYLRHCIRYDNPFTYTKYAVQNMLRDLQESPRGKAFLETQTLLEIAKIWDLSEEYYAALKLQHQNAPIGCPADQRRWSYQSRDEIMSIIQTTERTGATTNISMPMQFVRGNFCDADLPKMVVNRHITKNKLKDPVFGAQVHDRYFNGYMVIDGIRYETSCIQKSRRYAEQAAALVYLHANKLVEASYGFVATDGSRKYQHLAKDVEKTPRFERQLQQANRLHMGRNRRRQENREKNNSREESSSVLSPSNENVNSVLLVENDCNKESTILGSSTAVCSGDASCASDVVKRDLSQRSPDRETGKSKIFIRSCDEENVVASETSPSKLDHNTKLFLPR